MILLKKTFFALLILLTAKISFACSACFYGLPTDKPNVALRAGVITLLVVIVSILALFTKFFFYIRSKEKLQS